MDLATLIQLFVTAILLRFIYLHFKVHSHWKVRGIPGPTPWPIFGTTIYYFMRNKIEVDLDWDRKYGKVYGIYEGYYPVLRITDSQLCSKIFIKNFSSVTDRSLNQVHSGQMRRWIFFAQGNEWSNKRLMMMPMLTGSKLAQYSPMMSDCVAEFEKQVGADQGKPVTIQGRDHFMCLALDILSRTLHSIKMNTYRGKESDFHKKAFAFATFEMGYFFLWTLIPKAICRYFGLDPAPASKFSFFYQLGQDLLDQRRQEGQPKPDIIQAMLDAKLPEVNEQVYSADDDQDSHYNDKQTHDQLENVNADQRAKLQVQFRNFTDEERCSQMTFFFIAGFDTTSASLSHIFHFLAKQQAEQSEVYEEMVDKLPDLINGTMSYIEYKDLALLAKLDAFISESLRLLPPVTDLTRVVTNDQGLQLESELFQNGSLFLPKGSQFNFSPYIIHRDERNWPDAEKFDMTRFYKENRPNIKSGSYLPFGIGPRNCAGYRFASLTLKQITANILARYQVKPASGRTDGLEPKFHSHPFFLQLANSEFTLVPRN